MVVVMPFIGIIWFSDQLMATVCNHLLRGSTCPVVVPGWVWGATILVVMGTVLASVRRYWLDFHQGEYYLDLQNPDWRRQEW